MSDPREKFEFQDKCPRPYNDEFYCYLDDVRCASVIPLLQAVKRRLTDPEYQVCFLGVTVKCHYSHNGGIPLGVFIYELPCSEDPVLWAKESIFTAYRSERHGYDSYGRMTISRKDFFDYYGYIFHDLPIDTVIQAITNWLEGQKIDFFRRRASEGDDYFEKLLNEALEVKGLLTEVNAILQEQKHYLSGQPDFFAKAS